MSNHREKRFGTALCMIRDGLKMYAQAYHLSYSDKVGTDGVLGEEWKDIANGLLGLLNGETGMIDPGTFDSEIRFIAKMNEVDLEK